jgi:cytochrome c biogenesis protein CcdA/thiol-disulfide isomerase/thioredoxin
MLLLILFAFIAGLVTILSPCILPILPVVLAGSSSKGKRRPLGIVFGFIGSFTFFTLFLSQIVKIFGVPADFLRSFSVVVIFLFGLSFFVPKFRELLEKMFARLSRFSPKQTGEEGFWGGVLIGISIGLLWTPCVGPILASVISLALSGEVTSSAFLITLSYSFGTAIPMFVIIYGGQNLLRKNKWLLVNSEKIQRIFGVLMMLTALAIFLNLDRKFQTYILDKFPNYGVGLISFEDNEIVKRALDRLNGGEVRIEDMGKPSFNLNDATTNAPELIAGGEWFNSKPLALKDLRGKVVMVDFWTYTCINCIRTLPYLRNWHEKYADKGLVIIGVHTPEFEFEKNAANVKKAIEDFELKYPIMQDNNYATWRAYDNHYWPAKYIVDKNGKIRYTHFGEGEYDETEEVIQALLAETGIEINQKINNPKYQVETRTPELYLGYGRMGYFATPDQLVADKKKAYQLPEDLVINHFALSGDWQIDEERSMPSQNSTLVLTYEAKEVFLVMRPKGDSEGKVKVYLDDKLISSGDAGDDVKDAVVTVDVDRLYKLVKLDKAGQHILKLEFLDSNVELYAFTFG